MAVLFNRFSAYLFVYKDRFTSFRQWYSFESKHMGKCSIMNKCICNKMKLYCNTSISYLAIYKQYMKVFY